jgi:TRAP-type C4-dicarboxylate transport system substrate-binding protein
MVANAGIWQKLPPNLQEIVERNFDDAAVAERAELARQEQGLTGKLQGRGLIFNDTDIPAFRGVLHNAGLYAKWRDQFGTQTWSLLERTVGKLT